MLGFQYQLRKASMTETDAFSFLKGDNLGDFVTYSAFCDALRQVRFIGNNDICGVKFFWETIYLLRLLQVNLVGVPCGLTFQETRDLWIQADIDGNGVVDYEEFKVTIHSCFIEILMDQYVYLHKKKYYILHLLLMSVKNLLPWKTWFRDIYFPFLIYL